MPRPRLRLRLRPRLRPRPRTDAFRHTALAFVAVAVAALGVLAGAPSTSQAREPAGRTAPRLAAASSWSDEFNGPAGTRPDPRKWTYNTGGQGWGNRELEYYSTSRANAALDGRGNLLITARRIVPTPALSCWYGPCLYTSARLISINRFSQQYGHIEARIRIPQGRGLWPAFWALDNNVNQPVDPAYAEMDIMENIGGEPTQMYSSLHGVRATASGARSMHTCTGYQLPTRAAYAGGYHVFAADWDSTHVTFSVDGHAYATRMKATYGSAWTFDQPMFLVLNLAVGGTWSSAPDLATAFPARMVVDYVRVTTTPSRLVASPPSTLSRTPGGCETGH